MDQLRRWPIRGDERTMQKSNCNAPRRVVSALESLEWSQWNESTPVARHSNYRTVRWTGLLELSVVAGYDGGYCSDAHWNKRDVMDRDGDLADQLGVAAWTYRHARQCSHGLSLQHPTTRSACSDLDGQQSTDLRPWPVTLAADQVT